MRQQGRGCKQTVVCGNWLYYVSAFARYLRNSTALLYLNGVFMGQYLMVHFLEDFLRGSLEDIIKANAMEYVRFYFRSGKSVEAHSFL